MTLNKQRFVVDTNVIISATLFKQSVARFVMNTILSDGIMLHSNSTMVELFTVLQRRKFDKYIALADRLELIGELAVVSRLIQVTTTVVACRDPKDDKFLELALSGDAQAIVTGDDDLLSLNPFRGIPIVSPAQFRDMNLIGS